MGDFSTLDRYLYAIEILAKRHLCVRSVDVARYLRVSKASVSMAVRRMREQGLVGIEQGGRLRLTMAGQTRADRLSIRVYFFRQVLTEAGVEPSLALHDAVSFSWEMSETSFEALKTMLSAVPRRGG